MLRPLSNAINALRIKLKLPTMEQPSATVARALVSPANEVVAEVDEDGNLTIGGIALFAPIGASIIKSTNQTIESGGLEKLTWDSAQWDDASFFDNANDSLVIPVTGRYLITVAILGDQQDWRMRLYKNGVDHIGLSRNSANKTSETASIELALTAGDYLQIYVEQYSGNDGSITSGEGTIFAIHRTK